MTVRTARPTPPPTSILAPIRSTLAAGTRIASGSSTAPTLSFPNDGTNQRGYVACAFSNNIDEFTKFEGLFYYVHQNGRFQYPVKTARDYQDFNVNRPLLYNAPFERVQDYFVLFQNEDGVLNIH